MTEIWTLAALWLGLALLATLFSIWLRIATALSEIVVGTIAQLVIAFGDVDNIQSGEFIALWTGTNRSFRRQIQRGPGRHGRKRNP